ncbi:MAG: hypothetical protein ACTHK8_21565 [Ginsengibacter sp.]
MLHSFNKIYKKIKRKFYTKEPVYYIPEIDIKRADLLEISRKFKDAKIFIETGTFLGDTLDFFKKNFTKLYSIELSEDLADKAKKRFQNDAHISIVQGDSSVQLSNILKEINETCIFWLDGHYSSEFWVGKEFIRTAKGEKNTPIIEELLQIINHKVKTHIILIDDARCFNGDYDYPRIKKINKIISKHLPLHTFKVENDIIKIIPRKI